MWFLISYICGGLCIVFAVIAFLVEKHELKIAGVVGVIGTLLEIFITLILIDVPVPEIYATNGNSGVQNEVYFKTQWPLKVWYTLTPYDDPKENGIMYRENIPIEESVCISAKACFAGIKWSEMESRDFIINDDGELSFVETDDPGSSIKEIQVTLNTNELFPGDTLKKDMLTVTGTTIGGDQIPISDYEFSPERISEGKNEITVVYGNLQKVIEFTAHHPGLTELEAEYIGEKIQQGDELLAEQFRVVGIYEDGRREELTDYKLEPSIAAQSGHVSVTISKDGTSTSVELYVEEKSKNSIICEEQHTPNDGVNSVSVIQWSDTDLDINGKGYSGGLKIKMSNMFSSMGSGLNNSISSNIIIKDEKGLPLTDRFEGCFVVDQSMFGSKSYGTISIFVNGEERYSTGRIDALTTEVFPFDVDIDGVNSVMIKTEAVIKNGDFTYGIVNLPE